MLDGHILDEMKHKAPFARAIFMRQFLFARVDDEKWPIFYFLFLFFYCICWKAGVLIFMWQMKIATYSCHIKLLV